MKAFIFSFIYSCVVTLILIPFQKTLDLSNIALFYILLVVFVGAKYGISYSIKTSLLSALLYAHIFVPPLFSLEITELQYLLSAIIMLVVALLVGNLTASLKQKAEKLEIRELQSRALYSLAKNLAASNDIQEIEHFLQEFKKPIKELASIYLTNSNFSQENVSSIIPHGLSYTVKYGNENFSISFIFTKGIKNESSLYELIQAAISVVQVAFDRIFYSNFAKKLEIHRSSEQLRNSILSALSHDLRTPLTIISGLAESLLLNIASPDRQKAMLTSLHNQSISTIQLVTNLLEMAKLKSGTIELNCEWQSIDELIGVTIKHIKSQWRNREISLDIQNNLQPIKLDIVVMERVLINLLENAMKYAPIDMPIELIVRSNNNYMEIIICDSGPGVPDNEDIFQMFKRGFSETNIPGAGLGLSIAKTITEAHGGKIHAENRIGGGACFYVKLPLETPPISFQLDGEL